MKDKNNASKLTTNLLASSNDGAINCNCLDSFELEKTKLDKQYDFVNHPSHYNGHEIKTKDGDFKYETIELIEALVNRKAFPPDVSHSYGDMIKYMDRVGEKPEEGKSVNVKAAEDFEKIAWYANRAAKLLRDNAGE